MIKFTILLKRKADLSQGEFVEYHRTRHAPLFNALPEVQQHVRRYVQSHSTTPPDLPGLPPLRWDGTTELWFDDLAGLQALFTAPGYLATIRPDEARFLDLAACDFVLSTETVMIG